MGSFRRLLVSPQTSNVILLDRRLRLTRRRRIHGFVLLEPLLSGLIPPKARCFSLRAGRGFASEIYDFDRLLSQCPLVPLIAMVDILFETKFGSHLRTNFEIHFRCKCATKHCFSLFSF